MEQRGEIINRERARQLRSFIGLRYGNITPTDIDGFIDFGNNAFVFIELKCEGVKLSYGQRTALERLSDALEDAGKYSFVIIAEHNTPSEQDIEVSECNAVETRWKKQWTVFSSRYTLKEVIDKFLSKYYPNYIKQDGVLSDKDIDEIAINIAESEVADKA